MNKPQMKNIDKATVLQLKDLVQYQKGQIVSKTLTQNKHVSLTLFAFDQGEEISSHASHGDAMVTVLDGTARITIGDGQHVVKAGETIVMPAEVPHAVAAEEPMKFCLTVVF
ncbi:MAG: cupin domain-containing protein [Bacillota bacterium]|nr:cupin domain-containing protein [Bacillota bacterium]